jgi:translation initiation factor eIF-2B subunit gamma
MRKSVLQVLQDNRSVSTIKGDLIPLLVRQQFVSGQQNRFSQPCAPADDVTKTDLTDNSQCDMSLFDVLSDFQLNDSTISCHTKVQHTGLCLRANTLVAYCEANRQVARLQDPTKCTSRHGTTENLIGAGVTVGDKASIKSSVIGDQCVIADRVKLTNCVIMDHVTIESGANIIGCIVCSNACIAAGAELRDCLIGMSQHVTGKHTNDMILERYQRVMEI